MFAAMFAGSKDDSKDPAQMTKPAGAGLESQPGVPDEL